MNSHSISSVTLETKAFHIVLLLLFVGQDYYSNVCLSIYFLLTAKCLHCMTESHTLHVCEAHTPSHLWCQRLEEMLVEGVLLWQTERIPKEETEGREAVGRRGEEKKPLSVGFKLLHVPRARPFIQQSHF